MLALCTIYIYATDRQVEQETALLKETVEGAAKFLSEAVATTKSATEEAKQASVTRARAKLPCSQLLHFNAHRAKTRHA